jgi:anti-repressor protein
MTNEIRVIEEKEVLGKKFKIYGDVDNPLFLAKDVAEIIQHSNASKMIKDSDLEDDDIVKITVSYNGDDSRVSPPLTKLFLTEDGLYEVLMVSKLPKAKEFKKNVKEILKQIRHTGGYIPIKEEDNEETIMAKALIIANKTLEKKDKIIQKQQLQIEEMTPKAQFTDRLLKSKDNLLVREYAKVLQDEGFTLGEKKLYKWFRDNKYLMQNNEPYQRYMKYFVVIEKTIESIWGSKIVKTTKVTPQGQLYFYEKLEKEFTN